MPNLTQNLLPQNISLAPTPQTFQAVLASQAVTDAAVDGLAWVTGVMQSKKLLFVTLSAVDGASVSVGAKVRYDAADDTTECELSDAADGAASVLAVVPSSAGAAVKKCFLVDIPAPYVTFTFTVTGGPVTVAAYAWAVE